MVADERRIVPALRVRQWLPGWNTIDFDPAEHRAKPEPYFFIFSLPACELRSLSGISRRRADNTSPRREDLGIQRQHDPERSDEIGRFVQYGYPWSTLSEAKQKSTEFNDLRKPGWLPTAVVLNILSVGTERNGFKIADEDVVTVDESGDAPRLRLPYDKWSPAWATSSLPPFEVIDGQHRLWAFGDSKDQNFELPVVAFVGLDISWQAYLFWTINIKPKRINSSLAFDLYPLLRSEDWLDRAEGHSIYRETRAQELTEILWSHPSSPWYDKVNMLGERQNPWVSQSAWIKSLIATFVRPWDKRSQVSGGLFGGRSSKEGEVLGWSRAQQAAFLIFAWASLHEAVAGLDDDWTGSLRRSTDELQGAFDLEFDLDGLDAAFYGKYSLINTDQGVRGFLHVLNDMCYRHASHLKLNTWHPDPGSASEAVEAVTLALETIKSQGFAEFVNDMAVSLAKFDWRTSAEPGLDEDTRRAKLVFRGSGGYKELRLQLLEHLAQGETDVAAVAKRLLAL